MSINRHPNVDTTPIKRCNSGGWVVPIAELENLDSPRDREFLDVSHSYSVAC